MGRISEAQAIERIVTASAYDRQDAMMTFYDEALASPKIRAYVSKNMRVRKGNLGGLVWNIVDDATAAQSGFVGFKAGRRIPHADLIRGMEYLRSLPFQIDIDEDDLRAWLADRFPRSHANRAKRRERAVADLMRAGHNPGDTVTWEKFRDEVCAACGRSWKDKGFSISALKRDVKAVRSKGSNRLTR
jgi:hypothetical protein